MDQRTADLAMQYSFHQDLSVFHFQRPAFTPPSKLKSALWAQLHQQQQRQQEKLEVKKEEEEKKKEEAKKMIVAPKKEQKKQKKNHVVQEDWQRELELLADSKVPETKTKKKAKLSPILERHLNPSSSRNTNRSPGLMRRTVPVKASPETVPRAKTKTNKKKKHNFLFLFFFFSI